MRFNIPLHVSIFSAKCGLVPYRPLIGPSSDTPVWNNAPPERLLAGRFLLSRRALRQQALGRRRPIAALEHHAHLAPIDVPVERHADPSPCAQRKAGRRGLIDRPRRDAFGCLAPPCTRAPAVPRRHQQYAWRRSCRARGRSPRPRSRALPPPGMPSIPRAIPLVVPAPPATPIAYLSI